MIEDAHDAYERREEELGEPVLRELERQVLLQVIDRKWREHLYEMDYLQDGVEPAGVRPARPAGRVPARGLRHVQPDARGREGGGRRLPVQLPARGRRPEPEVGDRAGAAVRQGARAPATQRRQQALLYSAPTIDGEAGSGGAVMVREPSDARAGAPPTAAGRRRAAGGNRTRAGATAGDSGGRSADTRAGDQRSSPGSLGQANIGRATGRRPE